MNACFDYHAPVCAGDTLRFQTGLPASTTRRMARGLSSTTRKSPIGLPTYGGLPTVIVDAPRLKGNIHELSNKDDPGGDDMPVLELPPITRTTGCSPGASGDHNLIHIDIDFARGWHEGRV